MSPTKAIILMKQDCSCILYNFLRNFYLLINDEGNLDTLDRLDKNSLFILMTSVSAT